MIFVNTSLKTAHNRNCKRDRKVPHLIVQKTWHEVQDNLNLFKDYFKENFQEIDGNSELDRETILQIEKKIRKFLKRPIKNAEAKKWIEDELKNRKK